MSKTHTTITDLETTFILNAIQCTALTQLCEIAREQGKASASTRISFQAIQKNGDGEDVEQLWDIVISVAQETAVPG